MKLYAVLFAIAVLAAVLILAWCAPGVQVDAQTKRPFAVYESGGNCVYIGPYAGTSANIAVVPRPAEGC